MVPLKKPLERVKYTDRQGYYTDAVLQSPTVQAAIKEPEAFRSILMNWGHFNGYTANGITPIPTHEGEESWRTNIARATPLLLGIAWLEIEKANPLPWQVDPTAQMPKSQNGQGDEENGKMPVINYTPSAGSMIEPGFYRAKLSEIIEEKDGQFGPQLRLQWIVIDEDGNATDKEIRSWVSAKWHEKSRLFGVAKALLKSKCPQPPNGIDTDNLIGKRADLEVVPYKKQDGSDGTKIGNVYPFGTMTADEDAA
jgi:hypothetical protein